MCPSYSGDESSSTDDTIVHNSTTDVDSEGFRRVVSKRGKKSLRKSNSAHQIKNNSADLNYHGTQAAGEPVRPIPTRNTRRVPIIGSANSGRLKVAPETKQETETETTATNSVGSDDGFKTVMKRPPRQFIAGSKQSEGTIKGVPRVPQRGHVFVGRCEPSTTVEDILSHLTDENIVDAEVHLVATKSNRYTAFRISVPPSQLENILNPELWPLDIEVRKWQFGQKKVRQNQPAKRPGFAPTKPEQEPDAHIGASVHSQ